MLDLDKLYKEPVYMKRWYQLWWGKAIIAVIIVAFILAILVAISAYTQYKKLQKEQININNQVQVNNTFQTIEGASNLGSATSSQVEGIGETDESAIIGAGLQATTSAISIIEFSDFACPFCKATYPLLKVLISKYPDKINLIYRDFPIHDQSIALSLAARCSGEQGKFWAMHDWLFDNQDDLVKLASENLAESLIAEAKRLKLDETVFNTCLGSQKYLPYIAKDYQDGEKLNISGTPTMFIKIPGRSKYIELKGQLSDQDAENIEKIVNSLK